MSTCTSIGSFTTIGPFRLTLTYILRILKQAAANMTKLCSSESGMALMTSASRPQAKAEYLLAIIATVMFYREPSLST